MASSCLNKEVVSMVLPAPHGWKKMHGFYSEYGKTVKRLFVGGFRSEKNVELDAVESARIDGASWIIGVALNANRCELGNKLRKRKNSPNLKPSTVENHSMKKHRIWRICWMF
ncbi:hypothetical protein Hdeb2414_s0021g00577661 [Helianthus debilis subsp. tardiflorus]